MTYFPRKFLFALSLFCFCLYGAAAQNHAFNTSSGSLNVNYAGYLSKHDVVFNAPITAPVNGLTVGTGKVGAMIWNGNGMTMQVSGVDASQQTAFSAGLVNLYTNPGMDTAYSSFQQRLSLYDGIMTAKYDSNRTVTVLGSPLSEVMGIHVDDSRGGVSSVAVDISIWDLSGLPSSSTGMGLDVPDMGTWKTVNTYVDSTVVGVSRGQTDANGFGYTLAATVEGANYTTQFVNGSKVRLNITPSGSYTIWIVCASRKNASGGDSVTAARNALTSVKNTGYSTTLTNFKNFWHDFWAKSFVQYSNSNGDADYLENAYYLYNYMIAAGAYANYPFHFINGAFSAVNDTDSGKWSGAYWYWNQRDVYNSFLASNHADVMASFYNLYSRNFNALKSYTMTKYGVDGIWVPETMGWDGNARHTDESDYTKNIWSTAAEVAQNMYLRYKYTNDPAFLSNTVYPFMKEAAKFYAAKLSFNSGTGKYYVASSNAHETYWNVQNSIVDLAAVRTLFPIAIEASQNLGLDSSLRAQWQNILNNLQAYPVAGDGQSYLPHDGTTSAAHNNENITSELVWPYGVTGIGAPDYNKAVNNWNSRPFPYGNVWAPDAIQAARLGMGDNAYAGMKTMLQKYQSYPNGMTSDSNGVFEYIGVHLSVMNESLLQSYNDKIRVFPAVPGDSSMNTKFTLLAKGGFLVSSERESGEIKYVGIKSLYGNLATLINPWGTATVQVRRVADNFIVTTTQNAEFSFATTANAVYVVERTAKTLSAYTYVQLTGTANQGLKTLSAGGKTLGSAAPGTTPTRYEAENAARTGTVSVGNDSAASGGAQVEHFSVVGDAITFSNVTAGTTLAIGYTTANNPSQLSLYINGTKSQAVPFTPTGVWSGTYAVKTLTVTIPANASVKLQLDSGDAGANVDYIAVSGSGGGQTKYEAETGTVANGAVIANDSAASGGKAIQNLHLANSSVQIANLNGNGGGIKILRIFYAAGQASTMTLYVNGSSTGTTVSFASTGGWSNYTGTVQLNVNLNSGTGNNIRLVGGSGGVNIDYITIQ